jgi:SAM-dependent methyltransferase
VIDSTFLVGDRAGASAASVLDRKCPACGGAPEAAPRFRRSGFDIRACAACGLGWTEVAPGFDANAIYTRDYFEGGQPGGYADYLGSEAVLRSEFRSALRSLRQTGRTGGKLLEIGCAYGFFLREASQSFEVHGVEVCADAAAFCRRNGFDVVAGDLMAAGRIAGVPYDVMVMLDVIEHLADPREAVSHAFQALKPGGHLMITTGDWGSLLAKTMGPGWRLMTPPQHLFFYTRRAIRSLLEAAGFRVVSIRHPFKLVPLSLIAYQAQRMLGLKPRALPSLNRVGIPLNLFDAMRVIAVRE